MSADAPQPSGQLMSARLTPGDGYPVVQIERLYCRRDEARAAALSVMREKFQPCLLFIRADGLHEVWSRGELEQEQKAAESNAVDPTQRLTCVCGDPSTPGVVHCKTRPCHQAEDDHQFGAQARGIAKAVQRGDIQTACEIIERVVRAAYVDELNDNLERLRKEAGDSNAAARIANSIATGIRDGLPLRADAAEKAIRAHIASEELENVMNDNAVEALANDLCFVTRKAILAPL